MARRKRKTTLDLAVEASRAHCDLNVFAAVQALMESSLVHAPAYADEAAIVRICKRATAKCLKRYDAAMDKLASKPA